MQNDGSEIEVNELARRMQNGETAAFNKFADLFGPKIRAFLVRRGFTQWEAEDLAVTCVSESSLAVSRGKFTLQPGKSLDAFVWAIVRHCRSDWYKENPRSDILAEELATSASDEPDADLSSIDAVHSNLVLLSDKDQQIIELRCFEGETTFGEISARLQIDEGAARQRFHRAMKRLQALLEKDDRVIRRLERRPKKETVV